MEEKIKLELKFNKPLYKIIKQRKNNYMKKKKLKEISWEEYLKIRILINKKL